MEDMMMRMALLTDSENDDPELPRRANPEQPEFLEDELEMEEAEMTIRWFEQYGLAYAHIGQGQSPPASKYFLC